MFFEIRAKESVQSTFPESVCVFSVSSIHPSILLPSRKEEGGLLSPSHRLVAFVTSQRWANLSASAPSRSREKARGELFRHEREARFALATLLRCCVIGIVILCFLLALETATQCVCCTQSSLPPPAPATHVVVVCAGWIPRLFFSSRDRKLAE